MGDIRLISQYGYKVVLVTGVLFVLALLFDFGEIIFGLIFLIAIFIYRNPERLENTTDEKAILCPVDGKVTRVETKDDEVVVEIINSLFSVGTLRLPMDASLQDLKNTHGLFTCSFMRNSELLNEKVSYVLQGKFIKFELIMVAGVFARRLNFGKFNSLKSGRRIGFLSDGKVILKLPKNIRLNVSKDSGVRACEPLGFVL
ncbi:MAG: hypothetical protein MR902_05090 [Campylobacter sp.]|nr:hypothetical protein [Campylobacter sp.]